MQTHMWVRSRTQENAAAACGLCLLFCCVLCYYKKNKQNNIGVCSPMKTKMVLGIDQLGSIFYYIYWCLCLLPLTSFLGPFHFITSMATIFQLKLWCMWHQTYLNKHKRLNYYSKKDTYLLGGKNCFNNKY